MEDHKAVFKQLFDDALILYPTVSTIVGRKDMNDKYEVCISKDHMAMQAKFVEKYLTRLMKMTRTVHVETIIRILKNWKKNLDSDLSAFTYGSKSFDCFPSALCPISQIVNPVADFMEMASGAYHPFKREKDFIDFGKRISDFATWFDVAKKNMIIGIEKNITLPRCIADQTLHQLKSLKKSKEYLKPVNETKLSNGNVYVKRYKTMMVEVFQKNLSDFVLFFEKAYLPKCRKTISMGDLPNGKKMYSEIVSNFTNGVYGPVKAHEVGLSEVKRINKLISKVLKEIGYKGSVELFHDKVKNMPVHRYKDYDEAVKDIKDLQKRFGKMMKEQFCVFPSCDYKIKKISDSVADSSPMAYYYYTAHKKSSGEGVFSLNSKNLPLKYDIPSLLLHEGNPGHHYQIAISHDMKAPQFITHFGYPITTSFEEGWALYVEGLGKYDDPIMKYGQLNSELYRAIRLVVDTGLHNMGWSFDKAVKFFSKNSGLSMKDIKIEVYRYIADPGQALSYKSGQMQILSMKKEYLKKNKGDIKGFHMMMVENGSIPLDILSSS